MHQFERHRGLYFFQMSLKGVCIRSVFGQKIGPYKVCIFVNMGPSGKVAALSLGCKERMMHVQVREVLFSLPDTSTELEAVRLALRQSEKMFMSVESITPLGHQ